MKIVVVSVNFAPEETSVGKYTSEMVESLVAAGHRVRVITAPPYYPEWQVHGGYSQWRWRKESWKGAHVWRCPLWVPAKPSGGKRLLYLASFAFSTLPILLWQALWRPDIVWVVEPPLVCAPGVLVLSKAARCPAWLHVQDFEVDAAFEMRLLRGKRLQATISGLERWLMGRFARVSTISERMRERLISKGVKPDRIRRFPNWVDLSHIQPLDTVSPYRAELSFSSTDVVAMYSGNMGGKQGLELLGELAAALAEHGFIRFLFCGDGPAKKALMAQCAHLNNVTFLPLQPAERLNDLLGAADIHLLPQRADAADLVMPSKLTGMLASGRAIVATASQSTEIGAVLTARECGVITPPGDAGALANAVLMLANAPEMRQHLGRNARRYAESGLGRTAVLNTFEAELATLKSFHDR